MALTKPDKTLADYVAIAISPALIMAMVGAFVFFLLEISYAGEHAGRLGWTLFWFVLASVLISRISIEEGSEYAAVYGLGLAGATVLLLNQLVGFLPGAWLLLALIWWCTSKLTWDCTLIDEDQDASGEGLLQVAGIEERAGLTDAAHSLPEISVREGAVAAGKKAPKRRVRPVGRWERIFLNRAERDGQPHAPGLWVVYFSLAALPVFGIGQLMISREDKAGRAYGFVLLGVYVAAALGLLLTSSFLGLRRYLRQRYLQMPASMAAAWLRLGTSLGAAVLLLSVLLPRPEANYSLTALVDKIGSPPQSASEHASGRGQAEDGEGRRLGSGNQDGAQGPETRTEDTSDKARGAPNGLDPQAGGKTGMARNPRSATPGLQSPAAGSGLATLLKWVLYGLFAAIILRSIFKHGPQVFAALRAILRDLRNLLSWFPGRGRKEKPKHGLGLQEPATASTLRPFASFKDPFATGAAQRLEPAKLVCYSFDALQAWTREQNLERPAQQTPLEFSRALDKKFPELSAESSELARLYSRLAYDEQAPEPDCLVMLERLWRKMSLPAETASPAVRRG